MDVNEELKLKKFFFWGGGGGGGSGRVGGQSGCEQ